MFYVEKSESKDPNETYKKAREMQNVLDTVQIGDLILIENTLTRYDFEMKCIIDKENHQNAFFYATLIKNDSIALEIFKYLRSLDVDPCFKDKNSQTCLYYACREGKFQVCNYLITECGLPINEKDAFGQIPIYYAAREGKLEICKLLVESGCNINIDDNYGQTCLFYAVKYNHYEIVEFLVNKGIQINKIDKMNSSALTLSEKLKDGKIMQFLIKNGGIRQEIKHRKKHNLGKYKKVFRKPGIVKNKKPEMSTEDIIKETQKPRRYILLKILQNGEKIPLTNEDIQSLKLNYPEVSKLLDDKNALYNQVKNLNPELLLYDGWEKQARRLMTSLWKFKESDIFRQPVNPIELKIPNYFQVIKKPMDFSLIRKKLRDYQYTNFREFCNDINLVFDNCILFNGNTSQIAQICLKVKKEYERLYDLFKMEKFL